MNHYQYTYKSFKHYFKQHLAVLLVTLLSTTVLTGALIIGDSVRGSLAHLVDLRLGKVEYAMPAGDRFVQADLAELLREKSGANVSALLYMKGMLVQPESERSLNQIQVYGIDESFGKFTKEVDQLKEEEAIISENIANRLKLKKGDSFLLRIEKLSLVPANAPFVSDEEKSIAIRYQVKSIAKAEDLGRFSLRSNQVAPYNVFVNRENLAEELEMQGKANLLLADQGKALSVEQINQDLKEVFRLEDAGLHLRKTGKEKELISDRVFLAPSVVEAVDQLDGEQDKLLTYFVNRLHFQGKETPYSFVTSDAKMDLKKDEIIINSWLANDLQVSLSDTVQLDYFVIGALRKLEEKSATFVVKKIVEMDDPLLDRNMMPDFPGLSKAGSCNDWEAGVPVDFSKIRKKDEAYWKKWKGTPKAMIADETALQLWKNKYGDYTAIRSTNLSREKLQELVHPRILNLQFLSVRGEGKLAAKNMVDFGGLFLSLSFFIILAAIVLCVLIYALNLQSRASEIGVLSALGFRPKDIVKIRVLEALPSIIGGGILGAFGGIAYNYFLLKALNSVWQDVVRTNQLEVYLHPLTIGTGMLSGILISLLSIWLMSRKSLRKEVKDLIKEEKKKQSVWLWMILSLFLFLISIVIIVYAFQNSLEQNASLLLSCGALVLAATYLLLHGYWIKTGQQNRSQSLSLGQLAFLNCARNRKRSLATIVLLSLGIYSVLITGANRKTFQDTEKEVSSGTGAYDLILNTSLPVLNDLNTNTGKEKAGFYEGDLPKGIQFLQFRKLEGDDASCLNLNQVQKPAVLGCDSKVLDQRQAFSFAALAEHVDSDHPWLSLKEQVGDTFIPAFADQTVIVWGLKKSIGDTLYYRNEAGKSIGLILKGGLANSIFQGNILIDDEQFQKHFPSISGSRMILVDTPKALSQDIQSTFEESMQDYGLTCITSREQLAAFYSVENTYLSMFLFLGGLGLLIGTIGLGIVLMRNVWERKRELAVLQAIGISQQQIIKMLFLENMYLLLIGLFSGVTAASVGILPSLFSEAFEMPVWDLFVLILGILVSGLLWIWIPAKAIQKMNLKEQLKKE